MKVHVDFCVIPVGTEVSLTPYIAECQRIFTAMGLSPVLHAYGTNLEGEWDTVMDAVKRCHARLHEMGAPRLSSTLKLGTRIDRDQGLADKVESVQQALDSSNKA